jgi:hypothetical protein
MYNKYSFDIYILKDSNVACCSIELDNYKDYVDKNKLSFVVLIKMLDYLASERYNLKMCFLYKDNNPYSVQLMGSIVSMMQFRYDLDTIEHIVSVACSNR